MVRSFVLWPPALAVGILLFSAVPLLFLLLPYAWRTMSKVTAIDAFAMARPLQPGEELRRFPSPMGAALTTVYYSGTLGAAVIMLLAWIADNAVYTSSLRPLPGSASGGFSWTSVSSPLQAAVLFAADAGTSCSGSVTWADTSPQFTFADVISVKLPDALADSSTVPAATACLLRIAVNGFSASAPRESSQLLLNLSLVLPASAQSIAWSVSGVMTPAAKEVGAVYSAWATGTASAPASSVRGLASLALDVGVMPIVETDDIANASATGLMITRAIADATLRSSAAFVPGIETLPFTLTVQPGAQLFAINVIARVSFTQLIGGMVGLLSGLGAAYKLVFAITWKVRFKLWGAPYWERDALRKRSASSSSLPDAGSLGSDNPARKAGQSSSVVAAGLQHARGSLFSRPGGLQVRSRRRPSLGNGLVSPDTDRSGRGLGPGTSRRSMVRSVLAPVPGAVAGIASQPAPVALGRDKAALDDNGTASELARPGTDRNKAAKTLTSSKIASGSSTQQASPLSLPTASRRVVHVQLPELDVVSDKLTPASSTASTSAAASSSSTVAVARGGSTAAANIEAEKQVSAPLSSTTAGSKSSKADTRAAVVSTVEATGAAAPAASTAVGQTKWLRPTVSRRRAAFGPNSAGDDGTTTLEDGATNGSTARPSLSSAARTVAVAASVARAAGATSVLSDRARAAASTALHVPPEDDEHDSDDDAAARVANPLRTGSLG